MQMFRISRLATVVMVTGALSIIPLAALAFSMFHISALGRFTEIISDTIATKQGGVLILGDSIALQSGLPPACASRSLNVSVGGIGALRASIVARFVVPIAKPSRAIVAIGVNDVGGFRTISDELFRSRYHALLDSTGASLYALSAILPVETDKITIVDPARIATTNRFIREEARRRSVHYIAPPANVRGLTTDGLHLNAAGHQMWQKRIEPFCSAL
ncbi:SGNH/GDSL hydrolase family protein [Sphingomonas sp. SRS2]|uniref:SGNH/GDSL hydrolase family protein n=1 Tax=Sphingomonas sp. SRS2 TaxID=133190 RepID=UPI000618407E|nr:SGNH/GDSL hydrolase family protein [Sphingomonas sp. SRS2]KKC24681.1 hypothetical protein WP12_17765 [Sphingomonas sp. SRS2]